MLAVLLLLFFGGADLFQFHGERALVLLFVRTDCPISNRYAPEIQRLQSLFQTSGIDFQLIYPEPEISVQRIEKYQREYKYAMKGLPDVAHGYVARAAVHSTPEAAVFVRGRLVYHGRIDDRWVDIGKVRSQPTRHDLQDVLTAVIEGRAPPFSETKAIGCAIEAVK